MFYYCHRVVGLFIYQSLHTYIICNLPIALNGVDPKGRRDIGHVISILVVMYFHIATDTYFKLDLKGMLKLQETTSHKVNMYSNAT